jgi:demethylmenaquinone methyltransferase/2-methoxy-6-polyprenyl-1,4-benzoquinol methylase/phosphoethanolamine N-methyltransferase
MHTTHSHSTDADAATTGRLIRWARFYDLTVALLTLGRDRRMRERTVELAAIAPGDSVLEVGCGTGALTQRARARVGPDGRVCGIDPSAEMIAVARGKAARAGVDIDFRVASIEALPFEDDSFDVVLSSLMMHHLPGDLKSAGLAEVGRVLKQGGRLLIVDFKRPSGFLSHLAMATIFHGAHGGAERGVEDLPSLLTTAGFTDVRAGDFGQLSLGFLSARRS